MRVAALLNQTSANASEPATEDQASDHSAQTSSPQQTEFQLEITEDPPTPDQLKTILEYVGNSSIPFIVKGANTENEAFRKLKESIDNDTMPLRIEVENLIFRERRRERREERERKLCQD
jgi:hypothetical protein